MSPAAALPMADQRRFGMREMAWWAGAAALVLVAHAAIGYAMQGWRPAAPDGGPPQAQLIELSPMAFTPAMPAPIPDEVTPDQPDPAEEPEIAETEPPPEPPVEQAEPVVEPSETAPADAIEPTPPTVAERVDQPPLEEVVPDIAEAVTPDVVIPLPQPKPVDKPVEAKPKKQAKVKEPAEVKAKKPVKEARQRPKKEKAAPPRTTASVAAKPATRAAAPKSAKAAASRRGDSSKWDSRLGAWIRRHTDYPRAAKARRAEGSPQVTFTVDGSGRVLSARLARSSGDADLDRAALSALQGAKVPTPPPELGSRISRTAPFVFNLRN
ncbi:TonB family protein [Mesorhizobium mediterraneum]|uniref:Protein TonB n=2 Tax=Mesorhizobium TaxID=68287 RepID=A0AB36RCM9_9HYPH|nr:MULTISPECIES: energy transducer TonB [Mesorhizobium]AZO65528.1 TonB family protein [Mesorhizobium sp. M6A.T.Cr.TU.016.01.1.1]PAQ02390.1 energy transducer TonB [Mesorhizobium mediterraneum]RWN44379.1 MAG: TonB family protein [Mesorhizobium sp.]RWP54202.1 MAG: TonB family protein [Mesorhizobium sp.]RWQ64619.1 MAG: TonB family protein [Mesorhizobium sp.]